jgi:hypothetical protein
VVYRNYADQKFREYKTVAYGDALRRNTLRQIVLAYGRKTVACAAALRPLSRPGKTVVRALVGTALTQSAARANCYRADSSGCGRWAFNEDHGNDKANQEMAAVGTPLANLLGTPSLRGLGADDTSGSNVPVYLLGAAGLAALVYLNQ